MIILPISQANYSIQQVVFEAFVRRNTWKLCQRLQKDIFKHFFHGVILRISVTSGCLALETGLKKTVICVYNLNTVWNKSLLSWEHCTRASSEDVIAHFSTVCFPLLCYPVIHNSVTPFVTLEDSEFIMSNHVWFTRASAERCASACLRVTHLRSEVSHFLCFT